MDKIIRGYVFRMYPNPEQQILIEKKYKKLHEGLSIYIKELQSI